MSARTMLAIGTGAVAALLLLAGTRSGVTVSPDSVGYIAAARNFISGHGLSVMKADGSFVPVTAVPPLYSMTLGLILRTDVDLFNGARYLNLLLFAGTIAICFRIFERAVGTSGTVLSSVLVITITSVTLLMVFASAWSECLFIFFATLGLYWLCRYPEETRVINYAAVAFACAWITRYIGFTLVITGLIWIFMKNDGWGHRVRIAARYLVIAMMPMALWLIRNATTGLPPVGRSVEFHFVSGAHFRSLWHTIATWFVPERLSSPVKAALLLVEFALLVMLIVSERRSEPKRQPSENRVLHVMSIFSAVYLASLIASISLVDFSTPLDYRILAPAFIPFLAAGASILAPMFAAAQPDRARAAAIGALAMFVVACHVGAAVNWARVSGNGYWAAYAGREWRESATIAAVRSLPSEAKIFSNATEPIYLLTGRTASGLPNVSMQHDSTGRLARQLLREGNAIVLFTSAASSSNYRENITRLPVKIVSELPDGTLYTVTSDVVVPLVD